MWILNWDLWRKSYCKVTLWVLSLLLKVLLVPHQQFIVVSAGFGHALYGSAILSWNVSGNRKVKCHVDNKMLTWQTVATWCNGWRFMDCIPRRYTFGSPDFHPFPSCLSSDNALSSEVEILLQQRACKLGLCRHKVWDRPCRVWHRTTILAKENSLWYFIAAGSENMIAILKSEKRKAKQVWLKIEDVNNDVNSRNHSVSLQFSRIASFIVC